MSADWRLAVDIGGTFTDVVLFDGASGRVVVDKTLTTPSAPLDGVRTGVVALLEKAGVSPAEIASLNGINLERVSTPCTAFDPLCTPGITLPTITGSIASLQAIYEVQVGEHSFIALIQGGSTSLGGRLEGVIVSGWRIGAHVRVAFDTLSSCTDRDGVAHGPCFDGTIRVGRGP